MKCHKNEYELRRLFHEAKNDTPKVSFEDTKSFFLNATDHPNLQNSSNNDSSFFSTKSLAIMTTILSVIGVGVILFFNMTNEPQNIDLESYQEEKLIVINESIDAVNIEDVEQPAEKEIVIAAESGVRVSEENFQVPIKKTILIEDDLENFVRIESIRKNEKMETETPYRFPILTEEEIKENNKRKSKLVKQLLKKDKKKYSVIPEGTFQLDDQAVSVKSFLIGKSEVSNVEYRTFLFDLLITNRKDDFLVAKPDQSQWSKLNPNYYAPMAEYYFSHPAYDGYPVNNISRDGAEMYCKWLTLEVNKILKQKRKKALNDVRIPTNTEWVYAAKGGVNNAAYPWGGPYIKNDNGCYLANFSPEKGTMDEDGMEITAPVWSYAPNNYGLFCMSGNVAEMVYYDVNKSQLGARGGSWRSPSEEIQIDGPDRFKNIDSPNVNIGFRVVVSL